MNILIADDSKMSQMVIHKFMKSTFGEDVKVTFVYTGEEAVELYPKVKPYFCTIDIVMAGMDGVEASKKINSMDPNARIIIVTSTEQTLEDYSDIQAIKAVVKKPITLQKMQDAIKLAKIRF